MGHASLTCKTIIIIKTRHRLATQIRSVELSVVCGIAGETVSVNVAGETVVGAVRTERLSLAGIDRNLNAFVVTQVAPSQIVTIIASQAIGK